MKRAAIPPFLAFLVLLTGLRLRPQAVSVSVNPEAQTVLIRFGVTDKAGKSWTGSITPEAGGGEIISLVGYHFQRGDRIFAASHSWEFKTQPWVPAFQQVDLSPARPGPRAVFPNGVYATVNGGTAAQFRLSVGGNSYRFSLGDLASGKTVSLADGNIELGLVPTQVQLDATDSGEADYPGIAAGRSGRIAVAWQEYTGNRDRVVVREFDGRAWAAAETFESDETRDVFRTSAVYDRDGVLHVIWSAQAYGNWDLYERIKTAKGWQPVRRLTQALGTDLYQRVIADTKGDLWLAWQAFRGGQSDIFLMRYSGGKWGPEIQVSQSAADDWEPSIAASGDTIWVGWDGYDRGNYDVYVRPIVGGVPGPIRAITRSPRFQAHVSLATDAQGRLWIAFDEAEANWGKDYGYLVKDRGNPLYQSRHVRVVRLVGDRIEEPEASISEAFPLYLPDFLQYPQLQVSRDGRVTVLALQLTHADQVIEVWGVKGVWENVAFTLDGAGWKHNQILLASAGAHDVRAAVASDENGRAWAAWAADNREFGTGRPRHQTVHVARVNGRGAGGEIRMKRFEEQPDLAFPAHPAEVSNIRSVREYPIQSNGKRYRIMRGDLHRHTALSGDGVGDGSLWDFYRYMLDAANMDFATVTDHQGGGTAYDWWKTQKSVDLFLVPGRLTTIYSYERSVPYPNGHRNIVFPKRGAPILPISREESRGETRSADAVLPYLRQYDAIAFRHTTATNQGTDWKDHNNELEPLVEVYQGHRVAYEHEGGPKGATADKLYLQRSGYQPSGFIWNALAKGYRLGFEAASDHCSTHISYSCILSESDARDALIDAMRKRHSYGATDNIVMDFRVKANGKEYLQGEEIRVSGPYTLVVNVIGTGAIRRVDVIHNESYAYVLTPGGKTSASFTYTDPKPAPGENRYYVRAQQEDGNLAWSSPVWIAR